MGTYLPTNNICLYKEGIVEFFMEVYMRYDLLMPQENCSLVVIVQSEVKLILAKSWYLIPQVILY